MLAGRCLTRTRSSVPGVWLRMPGMGGAQWDWQGVVGLSVCPAVCSGRIRQAACRSLGGNMLKWRHPRLRASLGVPPLEPPRLEMEGRTRRGTGAVLRWHSTDRRDEKNRNGGSKDGRQTRPESPA